MYINLPSKNHYRRPASYTSKGYHTRRMAVDFAIPLITNVKNAKMLAEALVRKLSLDVSSVDSKYSHRTHTFPGLINIAAFIPGLVDDSRKDADRVTEACVSAGFTTALILPWGVKTRIVDRITLERVRANLTGSAYCNFALSVAASGSNVTTLDEEIKSDSKCLFIPVDEATPLSAITAHFASWPIDKIIVTNAKGSDLAAILLMASLHDRSIHITDVQTKEDLLLISLSKSKQLKVTCDVSVYSLFFNKKQYQKSTSLPSEKDQQAIWKNLDVIDVFSIGIIPYHLSEEMGQKSSPWSGVREILPLLLTAVTDGRLTLDDIRDRLHDNPVRIFSIPDQAHTHVEVVIGRTSQFIKHESCWSPLEYISVTGAVHRVIIHGQTVFLDGALPSSASGRDISSVVVTHPAISLSVSASRQDLSTSIPPTFKPAESSQLNAMTLPSSSSSGLPHSIGSSVQHASLPASYPVSHPLPHPAFHRRHILSINQFAARDVHELFSLAHEMRLQVERSGTLDILKGKVLCTLFYEPSTRTSSSFDAAMKRCGGEVVQINVNASSVKKGETLPDTIRTLACYGDAIVLRHPDVGSAHLAAKFSPVPIINAGDGTGEHPTQVSLVSQPEFLLLAQGELGTVGCLHD
jgi:carbamoyl-phosphate synthase/aspartate carbamoyltransferase